MCNYYHWAHSKGQWWDDSGTFDSNSDASVCSSIPILILIPAQNYDYDSDSDSMWNRFRFQSLDSICRCQFRFCFLELESIDSDSTNARSILIPAGKSVVDSIPIPIPLSLKQCQFRFQCRFRNRICQTPRYILLDYFTTRPLGCPSENTFLSYTSGHICQSWPLVQLAKISFLLIFRCRLPTPPSRQTILLYEKINRAESIFGPVG